jgi:hypothetical protein
MHEVVVRIVLVGWVYLLGGLFSLVLYLKADQQNLYYAHSTVH